ncbi:MAG: S1 RNA-binding domain-containing protein [Chloroflexi bacterium]|mgnify:CR=1 FL=1|nr:S1 RNA-binding domain-containing protein [Chloroflexota bacterium]
MENDQAPAVQEEPTIQPAESAAPAEAPARQAAKPPAVGTTFKGRVRSVVEFGAFVDIGAGRDGLLHISALKRGGLDKTIKVGDSIEVVVRRIAPEDNRISLVLPGGQVEDRSSKTPLAALKVGSTVDGTVVRLADFGAFVDIGAQSDGLLHVSELPWGYVNKPSDVMKVGDQVQVRILEVDTRRQRISLSMRQVQEEAEMSVQAEEADNEPLPTAFELAFSRARQRRPSNANRR